MYFPIHVFLLPQATNGYHNNQDPLGGLMDQLMNVHLDMAAYRNGFHGASANGGQSQELILIKRNLILKKLKFYLLIKVNIILCNFY